MKTLVWRGKNTQRRGQFRVRGLEGREIASRITGSMIVAALKGCRRIVQKLPYLVNQNIVIFGILFQSAGKIYRILNTDLIKLSRQLKRFIVFDTPSVPGFDKLIPIFRLFLSLGQRFINLPCLLVVFAGLFNILILTFVILTRQSRNGQCTQ